jgi:hypothetical protein
MSGRSILWGDEKHCVALNRLEDLLRLQILGVQIHRYAPVDPALLQIDAVPEVSAGANPVLLYLAHESERLQKAIEHFGVGQTGHMNGFGRF